MNNQMDQPVIDVDILIVEDSETQAEHLAGLLSRNGFRVRMASNGRLGLAAARSTKPALIISDISMPEMDGFAMCSELKKDSALQDVPVILLTSLTSLYDVIKGLDCGANNFIRKPFEEKYLLGRIRFILANREFRSSERVQIGMQITLGGQTHFVTAERQQIFDLLMSTYEEAIQMTEELRAQQSQIARSYQSIEGLYQIAATLNPAITEKEVAEKSLERALDLPGVIGGCIKLLGLDGNFRTLATHDFGSREWPSTECDDCNCHKKLMAGTLRIPEIIVDCPFLEQSASATSMARNHVSVPLTLGQRILGVMNLVISDPDAIGKGEDFQVLDTVGNQIAIALERANLYANMESLVNERTEALQAERNLSSAVVNTTGALVLLADPDGRIVVFNPACEQTLGWNYGEVRGRAFWNIFLPPERAEIVKAFFENLPADKLSPQIHGEWLARDGSPRKIIWSTRYLRKPDQSIEYFLATGIDVTELRLAEEKVQYLSNFDALTGLPNRVLLTDGIKLLQERALASKKVMGFLMIGIARLPLIRESLGTRAEQALLLQIADRLREWSKDFDKVARIGDSSFAVIAKRQAPGEFSLVARQILALLDQPFIFEQQDLHMEAYVGISIFPNDGQDFDSLSQCADAAMRRAMSDKAARYEFYTPALNRSANERFKLERALRSALSRDEFVLYYQPQVDLRTGRVVGLEALVRWQHPELGLISPVHFIGLAEETGLIVPIGAWVLRTACAQAMKWQRAGLPELRIAVNLSARQFVQQDLVELIAAVLRETGLPARFLDLELTESLVMTDVEHAIGVLNSLRALGVKLSIDDFGTGYSSLSYLKRFPIDVLKIDQSFVREIALHSNDAAISDAIISMAHSLGIKVIAEGVENDAQCEFLSRKMCDEVQGFLISRPLPADEIEFFLKGDWRLPDRFLRLHKPQRTLLLVDGEPASLDAMKQAVIGDEYQILVAESGKAGLDLLAQNAVDVIVSDQDMPGMTGAEFLRAVNAIHPQAVCILLSDFAGLQPVIEAVDEGAIHRFLTKPWNAHQLKKHVAEAFEHKEMADENRRLKLELRAANQGLAKMSRQLEDSLKQKKRVLKK
jgi:diguanylate cyclase (GGDEF)-like protein/PAS domain S-box-containing protein